MSSCSTLLSSAFISAWSSGGRCTSFSPRVERSTVVTSSAVCHSGSHVMVLLRCRQGLCRWRQRGWVRGRFRGGVCLFVFTVHNSAGHGAARAWGRGAARRGGHRPAVRLLHSLHRPRARPHSPAGPRSPRVLRGKYSRELVVVTEVCGPVWQGTNQGSGLGRLLPRRAWPGRCWSRRSSRFPPRAAPPTSPPAAAWTSSTRRRTRCARCAPPPPPPASPRPRGCWRRWTRWPSAWPPPAAAPRRISRWWWRWCTLCTPCRRGSRRWRRRPRR